MDDQKNTDNKTKHEPYAELPDNVVKNPNPRANENIHVSTDQPNPQNNKQEHDVGSEITDGEDG
jgi:hypothetical protein